ncbi:hypothetical protein NDU88_005109 [Pleurodeles waltl]|uniref:Uncharacterized protein n=1 Tax=Pleurodeles waltl TaxID=8319 RepID=A0AAV7PLQ0_PLEWA|nr:hypothetical protein NDU88_005109 [Pleurodeles waltl]
MRAENHQGVDPEAQPQPQQDRQTPSRHLQAVLPDWAVSRTNGRYFSHLCGKKTQLRDPDCWAIFSPVCAKIAAGRRRRRYWCEGRRKKKEERLACAGGTAAGGGRKQRVRRARAVSQGAVNW